MKYKLLILLIFIGLFTSFKIIVSQNKNIPAADTLVVDTSALRHDFLNLKKNSIKDSLHSLDPFFEKLRNNGNDVINIVHIGDSHIQAGYLTGRVRQRIQKDFGDAGRGLIVPLKLASTSQPLDYTITSSSKWEKDFLTNRANTIPIGIGGVGISPVNENVNFKIAMKDKWDKTYEFNEITVFCDEDAPTLQPSLFSHVSYTYPKKKGDYYYKIQLDKLIDSISLFEKNQAPYIKNCYFGFSLQNGQPGVLYHSIGVNGAHYLDYQRGMVFKQLQALSPELIIVSMGTNESFGRNLNYTEFKGQVSATIEKLKAENPNAPLLITIPPECLSKKTVKGRTTFEPNKKTQLVRKVLMDYARENNIAWWDLYTAMGGANSSKKWNNKNLLLSDGIHFTEAGYQLQAELFYNAFIKSYNDYITRRNRLQ